MTRTNIDIDDELIETVMKQNHLPTKKAAVDFALRRAVRRMATREELLALRGTGWNGDEKLEDMFDDTYKLRR